MTGTVLVVSALAPFRTWKQDDAVKRWRSCPAAVQPRVKPTERTLLDREMLLWKPAAADKIKDIQRRLWHRSRMMSCRSDVNAPRVRDPRSKLTVAHCNRRTNVMRNRAAHGYGRVSSAVSIGQVIEALGPKVDELSTRYLLNASKRLFPLRQKISPNAPFAPALALEYALIRCAHCLPSNAFGMCVVFNCPLDSLLVDHVPLGIVGVVPHSPSKFFRLNKKHVRGGPGIVPRIPHAAVTVFLKFIVAKLKKPFI